MVHTDELIDDAIQPAIGTVDDNYYGALAYRVNELYKIKLIYSPPPWVRPAHVEFVPMLGRCWNTDRVHEGFRHRLIMSDDPGPTFSTTKSQMRTWSWVHQSHPGEQWRCYQSRFRYNSRAIKKILKMYHL